MVRANSHDWWSVLNFYYPIHVTVLADKTLVPGVRTSSVRLSLASVIHSPDGTAFALSASLLLCLEVFS